MKCNADSMKYKDIKCNVFAMKQKWNEKRHEMHYRCNQIQRCKLITGVNK